MALSIGTNSGFVSVAPSSDPAGSGVAVDNQAHVTHDTSPANAVKITEIGWYRSSGSQDANFEVGLYAADGASGVAGTLLEVSRTNSMGTGTGWKSVSVDWTITGSTEYWLGVQVDNTSVQSNIDEASSGGSGRDTDVFASTLDDPFGGGSLEDSDGMTAIYAVYEEGGTNCQINIGDAWKSIDAMQINIGDTWKAVAGAQINIGDAWKSIF